MSKIIIGVTGKSGSGKSSFVAELGKNIPEATIVNVDSIGHEALCRPEILIHLKKNFGDKILDKNGNIDRKKLGNIVFAERNKMKALANLTYQYMTKKIEEIVESTEGIIVLEWILLPQDPVWKKCNIRILIEANMALRKEKVIQRDKISEEYFDAREKTSIEYSMDQFDYIFFNNYDNNIKNMVKQLLKDIFK